MRSRSLRVGLVMLLIAIGAGAGAIAVENQQRADALTAAEQDVLASLDRIGATLRSVGAAQEAYVVPGQADQPWFERVSAMIQQLYDELAATRPHMRSVEAAGYLDGLTAGVDDLMATDIRVREHLSLGQELMAADVILGDGRATVDRMLDDVVALASAERAAHASVERAAVRSSGTAIAAAAGLWLIGLVVLAWTGRHEDGMELAAQPMPTPGAASEMPADPPLDLDAVSEVAAAIAGTRSADALPGLFERAAPALGARGVMLWMAAGSQLFPAMASGYEARVVRRLPPLERGGENATVDAWTSGRVRTVAGEAGAPGAIVAPLFGMDRVTGVLAVEVPDGRERDRALQAAVAQLAAQLAGIVPAWPDASAARPRRTSQASSPAHSVRTADADRAIRPLENTGTGAPNAFQVRSGIR